MQPFTERARALWASGDYASVAEFLTSAGETCVRLAAIRPGDEVLDVACGTGNASILAARAGANVTGVDITPELLEIAARAAPDVRWVEGDAEALPFADESFDAVLSTFGVMFAPHHEVAAAELRRVVAPGGRIAVVSWTPEGTAGQLFATVGAHVPSPPGEPPVLWGTEAHVRELFAGMELSFTRDVVRFAFPSAEAGVAFYGERFGPLIAARAALEPEGRWEALHDDILALFRSHDVSGDGPGFAYDGEYLAVLARYAM